MSQEMHSPYDVRLLQDWFMTDEQTNDILLCDPFLSTDPRAMFADVMRDGLQPVNPNVPNPALMQDPEIKRGYDYLRQLSDERPDFGITVLFSHTDVHNQLGFDRAFENLMAVHDVAAFAVSRTLQHDPFRRGLVPAIDANDYVHQTSYVQRIMDAAEATGRPLFQIDPVATAEGEPTGLSSELLFVMRKLIAAEIDEDPEAALGGFADLQQAHAQEQVFAGRFGAQLESQLQGLPDARRALVVAPIEHSDLARKFVVMGKRPFDTVDAQFVEDFEFTDELQVGSMIVQNGRVPAELLQG